MTGMHGNPRLSRYWIIEATVQEPTIALHPYSGTHTIWTLAESSEEVSFPEKEFVAEVEVFKTMLRAGEWIIDADAHPLTYNEYRAYGGD